jgi:hypothetical protein
MDQYGTAAGKMPQDAGRTRNRPDLDVCRIQAGAANETPCKSKLKLQIEAAVNGMFTVPSGLQCPVNFTLYRT